MYNLLKFMTTLVHELRHVLEMSNDEICSTMIFAVYQLKIASLSPDDILVLEFFYEPKASTSTDFRSKVFINRVLCTTTTTVVK